MTVPNLNTHLAAREEAEKEAALLVNEAVMLANDDLDVNYGHTNEVLHAATQAALAATILLLRESHRSYNNFRIYIARLAELLPPDERDEMLSAQR
jgi:hypothetical protein